jgi:hypothetical protein
MTLLYFSILGYQLVRNDVNNKLIFLTFSKNKSDCPVLHLYILNPSEKSKQEKALI